MKPGESPYQQVGPAPGRPSGAPTVTLVAGTSFVICSTAGDIEPGGEEGYYAGDTRLIDSFQLLVNGARPRLLRYELTEKQLTTLGTCGDPSAPLLLVSQRLRVSDRLELRLELENLEHSDQRVLVEAIVTSDFADIFDVKRGIAPRTGFVGSGPDDNDLRLAYENMGFQRGLRFTCSEDCEVLRNGIQLDVHVGRHQRRTTTFNFLPESSPGTPLHSTGFTVVDADAWEAASPRLHSTWHELEDIWHCSRVDIGSLLLAEPGKSHRPIVAAGSPWFMALFGRDSLITSLQCLALGTSLGLGSVGALAERQGQRTVPETDEEPGKILHEVRAGEVVRRPGGWGGVYYGSVDATPLFVMTLAELWRWGAPPLEIAQLLPAAERAVEWILGAGDRDGDGFVEYDDRVLAGAARLKNQGWKDSDDAIRHPDGSRAQGPIALVEVQGYCVAALRGLADLRAGFGTGDPEPLRARAEQLASGIEEQFWIEGEDCYGLALDGRKELVSSVSSNAGHLLWTGVVRPDRATRLAKRLMADDLFNGHGLRTLSSTNGGYNPLSYHCGTVWPHDTSLSAAGMYHYGQIETANRLAMSLLATASRLDNCLPELFGGLSISRYETPVPYPTSCAPQAWASGAPFLLMRAMLGIHPNVPAGCVKLRPMLPDGLEIELDGMPLGRGRLSLRARGRSVEVLEAPNGLDIEIDVPAPGH